MAETCPVCNKKIGFNDEYHVADTGFGKPYYEIHASCKEDFDANSEEYGVKVIKKTQSQINLEKEVSEQRKLRKQKRIEEKSVHVKSIDMPFGEMVAFIFKWTMASIPTAIFLAILFLLFTAS